VPRLAQEKSLVRARSRTQIGCEIRARSSAASAERARPGDAAAEIGEDGKRKGDPVKDRPF
jgi:hypothetical protein